MISYYSFLSTLTQHLKKTLYHNVSPTSFIEGIRTGETSLGSVEECEGVTTSDGKHWGSITLCEFIVCQLLMNHNVIIIIKLNNGIKNMCWPMYNIFLHFEMKGWLKQNPSNLTLIRQTGSTPSSCPEELCTYKVWREILLHLAVYCFYCFWQKQAFVRNQVLVHR